MWLIRFNDFIFRTIHHLLALSLSDSLWLAVRLSLSGSLWLSLAHSGSLWLTLARCPAHSGSLWLSLACSPALSGSLLLALALSGSLLLSEFAYNILARLTRPLLSSQRRCCAATLSAALQRYEMLKGMIKVHHSIVWRSLGETSREAVDQGRVVVVGLHQFPPDVSIDFQRRFPTKDVGHSTSSPELVIAWNPMVTTSLDVPRD